MTKTLLFYYTLVFSVFYEHGSITKLRSTMCYYKGICIMGILWVILQLLWFLFCSGLNYSSFMWDWLFCLSLGKVWNIFVLNHGSIEINVLNLYFI